MTTFTSTEITTIDGRTGTWNQVFEFQGVEYGYLALDEERCHHNTPYFPGFVKPTEWFALDYEQITLEDQVIILLGTDEGDTVYFDQGLTMEWLDRILAMTTRDAFIRLEEIIDKLLLGVPSLTALELVQRILRIDSDEFLDEEVLEVFVCHVFTQKRRADRLAYHNTLVTTEIRNGIRVTRMPF